MKPRLHGAAASRGPSSGAWIAALVLVIGAVLVTLGLWTARDPRRRKRAIRRFERTWTGVEIATERAKRRFERKRARIEAETQRILEGLSSLVDDLPFVSAFTAFPEAPTRLYGHGAFMGAAPALIADPKWRRILAYLMPDVYRDVRVAVERGIEVGALIPMFENNPVMCAYGVANADHDGNDNHLVGMEWDVFVDGDLVDAFLDGHADGRDEVVRRIVDTLVIAHASTTDTVQEQIGLCQFRDVRRTRKAQLGGVEHAAWLDLFARALRLSEAPDLAAAIGEMSQEPRVESDEECRKYTFARPLPAREAIADYCRVSGRPRFSVVLEIKSLRSTPELLQAMVLDLNRRGIHVAAVGSFLLGEIAGTSALRQVVDDAVLPGPREILFMHFAGDLQAACDRGLVPVGTSVMFNGASLLGVAKKGSRYSIKTDVIREMADYHQRFDLHLGLYVQENDCDVEAAALLSEIARTWPNIFDLGFAWGGLGDQAAIAAGTGDHRGFGGQRLLERLGYARHWVVGRAAPS